MNARQIGILTNDPTPVFQRNVIAGVREVADARDYEIVIETDFRNAEAANRFPFDPFHVQGVLVIANAASNRFLQEMHNTGVPITLVSHQVPGSSIPAVFSNNAQGIAALVTHLVKRCGRRRLVYVGGIADQIDAIQREMAFADEVMRHNLKETHFLEGAFSAQVAVESLRRWRESGTPFDAVLAADYLMAIAIVEDLRASRIAVPEQVAVVGFGNGTEAEDIGLTTVSADITELGQHAARQLIRQIEGLRIRGTTTLSVELVVRETCGYCLIDA